jgi:hypothetical protein
MADNRQTPIPSEEPTQKTAGGLEIPIPRRDDFFDPLKRAAQKRPPKNPPSPPDPSER